jgi:hypothetical protein
MTFEIEQPVDAGHSPVVEPTKPRLLGLLGPGLITGASDDDPSGIATYSQAGAQFVATRSPGRCSSPIR